jgi:hypothetical protein
VSVHCTKWMEGEEITMADKNVQKEITNIVLKIV